MERKRVERAVVMKYLSRTFVTYHSFVQVIVVRGYLLPRTPLPALAVLRVGGVYPFPSPLVRHAARRVARCGGYNFLRPDTPDQYAGLPALPAGLATLNSPALSGRRQRCTNTESALVFTLLTQTCC